MCWEVRCAEGAEPYRLRSTFWRRMTAVILDSGGVTGLLHRPGRLQRLRGDLLWPAHVPAVVLAEVLTGDHRRDFHVNRLLKLCQIWPVTEPLARVAAHMRTKSGRAATLSVTDAIVVALAGEYAKALILTSDPGDLAALAAHSDAEIRFGPM
jgi:predicted nucleic acid-binding protein